VEVTMPQSFASSPGGFTAPKTVPVAAGPKLLKTEVPLVAGFIPAGALIPNNYVIPHRDPRTHKGYQRLPQEARVNELANDLKKGRVALPTSILLNIRNRDAKRALQDGHLNLDVGDDGANLGYEPKFYVVDGQHRVLALEKLIEEDPEKWSGFQFPFVCMLGATEAEEMEQFHVVNSKAKSVKTDLAYELLSQRASKDPTVMPALIERGRDWQVHAQNIVRSLSEVSPVWRDRIRFAAMEKGHTIMPSASMVTSLKQMLATPYFKVLSIDQQVLLLDAYWRGIRDVMPEAFDEPQDFAIQKGVGVIVLHTVLMQVIEIARSQGAPLVEPETYRKILKEPLEGLEGDGEGGNLVRGLDFWRASSGAAGVHSSSSGRRVLIAKIQSRLPAVTVQ
jgi:DGQHR domain-containing protein